MSVLVGGVVVYFAVKSMIEEDEAETRAVETRALNPGAQNRGQGDNFSPPLRSANGPGQRSNGRPGTAGRGEPGRTSPRQFEGERITGEMTNRPEFGHDFELPRSSMVFSWAPPFDFAIGAPGFDQGTKDDEKPQTMIVFTEGFWVAQTEVTQAEFKQYMGENPSHYLGDGNLPVENVTWFEAMEFCEKLNQEYRDLLPDGYAFTLPTQSQFEAMSAEGSNGLHGGVDDIESIAWASWSGVQTTQRVGQLPANEWGLHDTFGNVAEWTRDWYGPQLPGASVRDWEGPVEGTEKVVKGGTFNDERRELRVFNRYSLPPDERRPLVGFRVALAPVSDQL
ncbi:MAG: formylglycine-generating enzyme family protein [Puniceicoccales bacterium]